MSDEISTKSWGDRVREWFPDREFFMRADGEVRFIKVSSRLQKRVAGGIAVLLALWLVALAVMAWGTYRAEADLAALAQEKARVASASKRIIMRSSVSLG